ncbi:MAG TPA: hypothetical protein VGZ27_00165 [Vicinamibacterales bacterium]|nr:hypothetical protein [Vicinamibacterales bacterium]
MSKVMGEIIQLERDGLARPHGITREHDRAPIHTRSVYVVYTSIEETLTAVRIASALAKELSVPLTVVHTKTVPYVLPVDAPNGLSPIQSDVFLNRVRDTGLHSGVDVRVRVYLCREIQHVVPIAFRPHSLIVIAGHRSWWPTRAERWRRALEAAGHFVLFVDDAEHQEESDA